ncbi:MAG: AraC family transcriptional regulator [Bacteroidetes bacterium]|nr:AraC family transcriptional regulator [Bacteroidota bacterium]
MEPFFRTLQDFLKSVGLALNQELELTVNPLKGLHGVNPIQSPSFRTDYFSFLLISAGKSSYSIDGSSFELGAGSFYFTNPGHLKSFKIDVPLEGFILTFSEKFLKQMGKDQFFTLFPFLIHETTPVMKLDAEPFTEMELIFSQMWKESNRKSQFQESILENQLLILLYKTRELLTTHRVTLSSSGRNGEIVSQFKNLLNENFRHLAEGKEPKILSVKEMGSRLNIHPNHLTTVITSETGKSPSAWIQERTLAECRTLLSQTNRSVSDIALSLGFTDATHLARFFRKQTGLSPTEFKTSIQKKL